MRYATTLLVLLAISGCGRDSRLQGLVKNPGFPDKEGCSLACGCTA